MWASVVTQVVVDKNDPAFVNLSKPIGPFYSEEEAKAEAENQVQPSKKMLVVAGVKLWLHQNQWISKEINTIRTLLNDGQSRCSCQWWRYPGCEKSRW